MTVKKGLAVVLSILCTVAFVLSALCFSIERVAYNENFYEQQMSELSVTKTVGVGEEELKTIVANVVSYLKGDREDFQITVSILGRQVDVFNERELAHMKDVQNLFRLCGMMKWGMLGLGLFALVAVLVIAGAGGVHILCKTALVTILTIAVLLGVLGAWYALDFDSFWTAFHKLSFNNDLWQMLSSDRIIMLFPAEFFMAAIGRIIFWFGGILAAMGAVALGGLMGSRRGRRGRTFG